jgi:hypothetical protein
MRKTNLRPVQNQTGLKYEPDISGVMGRPTGRVDHIGANHKTCHCRFGNITGGTIERSKTMGL